MIISPVDEKYPITQGYGERPEFYSVIGEKYNIPLTSHDGIDIGTPLGTPVSSPLDGIMKVGFDPDGYGNFVRITGLPYNKAGDYREIILAHLTSAVVETGDEVRAGDLVGFSGNTGNSSGSHLHFALRRRDKNGQVINYINNCGWQNIFAKGWILQNKISKL